MWARIIDPKTGRAHLCLCGDSEGLLWTRGRSAPPLCQLGRVGRQWCLGGSCGEVDDRGGYSSDQEHTVS